MLRILALLLTVLVASLGHGRLARGADAGVDRSGVFSVQVENDLWGGGTDRHYTHGTRLSWVSGEDVSPRLARAAAYVPVFSRTGAMRTSYALGQSIFTPEDISRRSLIRDDRPYAGWLYVGVGLLSDHRVRDGALQSNRLDSLELNFGLVGPQAYAGDVQTAVHELIGSPRPHGWKHQLRNEPGLMLVYDRQWQAQYHFDLHKLGIDVSPHVGGALGNVMTYLAAGAMLRFGRDLPTDYGPPRIQPSLPGSGFFHANDGFGWYLFAGAEGRAVLHNIFLDGNTFTASHSVDREPWVGDLQAGLVLTWKNYRLSFTNIFRSKEFTDQRGSADYGSISLSMRI